MNCSTFVPLFNKAFTDAMSKNVGYSFINRLIVLIVTIELTFG